MPAQQYVQTPVVQTPVVQQQVAYTPTTYAADPMFFNFGRYFNNNIGGKVYTCMRLFQISTVKNHSQMRQ